MVSTGANGVVVTDSKQARTVDKTDSQGRFSEQLEKAKMRAQQDSQQAAKAQDESDVQADDVNQVDVKKDGSNQNSQGDAISSEHARLTEIDKEAKTKKTQNQEAALPDLQVSELPFVLLNGVLLDVSQMPASHNVASGLAKLSEHHENQTSLIDPQTLSKVAAQIDTEATSTSISNANTVVINSEKNTQTLSLTDPANKAFEQIQQATAKQISSQATEFFSQSLAAAASPVTKTASEFESSIKKNVLSNLNNAGSILSENTALTEPLSNQITQIVSTVNAAQVQKNINHVELNPEKMAKQGAVQVALDSKNSDSQILATTQATQSTQTAQSSASNAVAATMIPHANLAEHMNFSVNALNGMFTSPPVGQNNVLNLNISHPLQTTAWQQAFAQQVVWMLGQNQQLASITLNPPELGPVQLMLELKQKNVDVLFIANQADTRQAIANAIPQLNDLMKDAGFQLQANVGEHGSSQQAQQFMGNNASRQHLIAKLTSSQDAAVPTGDEARVIISHSSNMIDTFV